MQHLRVPKGLLRALCYPGGQRLSQRISRVKPPEPELDAASNWVSSSVVPISTSSPVTVRARTDFGNLSNESYRFFVGSKSTHTEFFQCRGCLLMEYSKERKLFHMRNCRSYIAQVIGIIRRDKVCVICNTSTDKECWTVPLCSDVCIEKYRFCIPQPWHMARLLLSRDGASNAEVHD
jgi:hypothetical protein